ncbi:hypothetical protein AMECASPLE_013292, partial [Ameca splendens]
VHTPLPSVHKLSSFVCSSLIPSVRSVHYPRLCAVFTMFLQSQHSVLESAGGEEGPSEESPDEVLMGAEGPAVPSTTARQPCTDVSGIKGRLLCTLGLWKGGVEPAPQGMPLSHVGYSRRLHQHQVQMVRISKIKFDPGYRASKLVRYMLASQMTCTLIECTCFLFTYTNSLSALVAIAIAPITFGKLDVDAKCSLILACSPTVLGNLMYQLVILPMLSRIVGIIALSAGCDIPDVWIISHNYVVPKSGFRQS